MELPSKLSSTYIKIGNPSIFRREYCPTTTLFPRQLTHKERHKNKKWFRKHIRKSGNILFENIQQYSKQIYVFFLLILIAGNERFIYIFEEIQGTLYLYRLGDSLAFADKSEYK